MLQTALGLWRGPMLVEFADEEFVRDEVIRLSELRAGAIEQRIWAELELGHHDSVVEELQDLVSRHPYREGHWEQLMLALYRSARQSEALRAYQTARTVLANELGIEPGPALRDLEARILAQDPALHTVGASTAGSTDAKLPLQRTSFVGRKTELASAAGLLSHVRLLTFTGAPGSGKTRLALQLAAECKESFPHGVCYVPLASIANARLFDDTVADALGVREVAGESSLDGLKAFLADRNLLLVLDNFEHLLAGASRVGELLDAAPLLTILVTSRTPLSIGGEQEFPVPPMNVPRADDFADLERLGRYDAIELFITRARAVDPAFELTPDNVEAVVDIAAKVDGLPLAIELAAARIKLLDPGELLRRLEERLTLLTDGPTDALDRHRTMRDAVAWSYDLLEFEEQSVFRSLGVFHGGFTLEAAAAVAGADETDALNAIDSLLGQSLLYRPVGIGPARFAMLEIVRAYALELLSRSGEQPDALSRHATYYQRYALSIAPQLTEHPGSALRNRLTADLDNLRAAMEHSLQAGKPDIGIAIAGSIWRFWESTDQLNEGREWLEALLAHPNTSSDDRIAGLEGLAGLAYWQADYDEALAIYSELLDGYRSLGDQAQEAETLYSMSLSASWKKDLDTGKTLAEQAQRVFDELGSRQGVAKALIAEATPIWWSGDYATAYDMWREALEIADEVGDRVLALTGLAGLAGITSHLGRNIEALEIALDGVAKAVDAGNTHVTVWMLDLVAAFAAPHHPEQAVRLSGAADRLRTEAGGGMTPEAIQVDGARKVAEPLLTAAEVRQEWRLGQTLELEEAIDLADRLGRVIAKSSSAH